MCLSHDDLQNHYTVNFELMQNHKYSLTELEHMMPWEREVYLAMLIEYLKDEAEKQKQRK